MTDTEHPRQGLREAVARYLGTHDHLRPDELADGLLDLLRGHVLVGKAGVAIRIAEAIGDDSDPGLSGTELDAWNAATVRAVNIARNFPLAIEDPR